ncbi:hypothetical protein [Aquimarina pacifica]|uniref:hypothetical protein n=1 Tax=Aquimarina pacifica TaxID=1296415 RepID=UPI00046FA8DF|nr:hypothetical protein [Aquimarina pacifica]
MIKNIILICFAFLSLNACSQKNNIVASRSITIVDSLKFVKNLPDENFYPSGDEIIAKILSSDKKTISPALIEKIDDTTSSQYRYADYFNYKSGDIALELLYLINKEQNLSIRMLIQQEFTLERDISNDTFNMLFYELFHQNNADVNMVNRKKMKAVILNWYDKNLKN